jgi:hypothetical protein
MICPNCKSRDTEYLETWCRKNLEIDYFYCWECDFLWKIADGNFEGGAVVHGGQQDFPSFDDMEIEVVKSLNCKELDITCIYCGSTVIRSVDRRRLECTMCGAFWEVLF